MRGPATYAMSWSGGKDSALALQVAQDRGWQPKLLLTQLDEQRQSVNIHQVPKDLIQRQAAALGLPLRIVWLPTAPDMARYEQRTQTEWQAMKDQGITHVIFGDLFLEDIRAYREAQLAKVGLKAVFPLWERDTRELLAELIDRGFSATTVCVDAERLPKEFAGRKLDQDFLDALPADVDPCGERGEYHSFVWDSPGFAFIVAWLGGEVYEQSYEQGSLQKRYYLYPIRAQS